MRSNFTKWLLFPAMASVASLTALTGPGASADEVAAEVVVVGATPAGIASAVAAARLGSSVILLEATDHVGGMLSNGLTSADIIKRQAVAGLYLEYTRRVLAHYRESYGPGSPQVERCDGGHRYEPHVAEKAFLQMLEGEKPRIRVLHRRRLKGVRKEGDRVAAVVMENLSQGGQEDTYSGKVFIDATYEGDLAAGAGVPYRVGREGRKEYGEAHAGVIYSRVGKDDFLPGSTGLGDGGTQAYNFRLCVTDRPENRVPVAKPAGYRRDDYRHLPGDIKAGRVRSFDQAVQLWPMPNGKADVNNNHPKDERSGPSESTDLAEENWPYPDAGYDRRKEVFDRTLSYVVGLIWTLQNDDQIPESFRREASRWGLCKDEFADNGHLPRQMYVREARRILGEYILTEHDGKLGDRLERTRLQPKSIAIGEYPFDCHAVHKHDPARPGIREGYIYLKHPPLQVPYGVIVPRRVEGLLVPVCCSASHVAYQTLRMEPVLMALGQAAGMAAHLSARSGIPARQVSVDELQRELVERQGVITYFDDLPFDHPAFAALQFLGAHGLDRGYRADPEATLTRKQGWEIFGRLVEAASNSWAPPADRPDEPLGARDLATWLRQVGMDADRIMKDGVSADAFRVRDFAEIIYRAYGDARTASKRPGK